MNEFMMLLWLADVVERLGGLVFLASFLFGLSAVFAAMHYEDCDPSTKKFLISVGRKTAYCIGALALLAFIAPSKQTIYIAAAGNATKTAMQTQTGQKLIKAFDKKVDEYLKDEKE